MFVEKINVIPFHKKGITLRPNTQDRWRTVAFESKARFRYLILVIVEGAK